MGVFKNTEKYVKTYGSQVEQEIENRLYNQGKYASGYLYDSIEFKVKDTGKQIALTFKMASYGDYVDKGVNGTDQNRGSKYSFKSKDGKGSGGKSAFITALQKWCRIKGIPEGAAFPIRRKIWKMGIPATNFFTIPTTRRLKQFNENVKKNMAMDVEQMIQKEFKLKKSK